MVGSGRAESESLVLAKPVVRLGYLINMGIYTCPINAVCSGTQVHACRTGMCMYMMGCGGYIFGKSGEDQY